MYNKSTERNKLEPNLTNYWGNDGRTAVFEELKR